MHRHNNFREESLDHLAHEPVRHIDNGSGFTPARVNSRSHFITVEVAEILAYDRRLDACQKVAEQLLADYNPAADTTSVMYAAAEHGV
jgi:hypothetical protein